MMTKVGVSFRRITSGFTRWGLSSSTHAYAAETVFSTLFMLRTIILPRQARDKDSENAKKEGRFLNRTTTALTRLIFPRRSTTTTRRTIAPTTPRNATASGSNTQTTPPSTCTYTDRCPPPPPPLPLVQVAVALRRYYLGALPVPRPSLSQRTARTQSQTSSQRSRSRRAGSSAFGVRTASSRERR
jgi:hypothetical protein